MDRREAFSRIEMIREQLARAEAFCTYRAASTASTGAIAFFAAFVQWRWQLNDVYSFLHLWVAAAVIGMIIVGTEMTLRCVRTESMLQRDATLLAIRQFVPALVAGLLLTIALERFAFEALHLLPGLWAIIFALGIFASRPGLPRAANFVGAYYLFAGLLVLAVADNRRGFEAWPMPLIFGIGQVMAAAVLHISRLREQREQIEDE